MNKNKTIRVLRYIEVLYLPNNNIFGVLPRNIGKMETLIELNLSWNKFSGNFIIIIYYYYHYKSS